jgi:hypothetical protein
MAGHNGSGAMAEQRKPRSDAPEPEVYTIRVRGQLGREWAEWFAGLAITPEANGDTLLTGPVADQAALHGVLKKVRDLGLPLLAVNRVGPGKTEAPSA